MSWYRQVDVRIHGDERYLRLTPDEPSGRALFKHLLICEENGPLPGVVRVGAAALAEALEWLPERLRERFGELFRERLAEADWKVRLVFLPNGIKYNPPNNPNVILGWSKHWDALPECALKTKIWERFHSFFLEDAERRQKENEDGSGDKKADPRALLNAFLRAMPKPSETVPLTVTVTVPLTVPLTVPETVTETVGDFSAGGRARQPEPEPEPERNPEPDPEKYVGQTVRNGGPVARAREDFGESTATRRTSKRPESPPYSPDFELWWCPYPNKTAKAAAWAEWERKRLSGRLRPVAAMLSRLEAHKNSRQWLEKQGAFIPHARTYLHQERYADEEDVPILPLGGTPSLLREAIERDRQRNEETVF